MKFQRLDARYAGHQKFTHFIDFFVGPNQAYQLNEFRIWCWETLGPSCEYDIWKELSAEVQNPRWCWIVDGYRKRILLDRESASWATMKWSEK